MTETIVVLDPIPPATVPAKSPDELLAQANIVSLHCPLTPETTGLIHRAAFSRMKPGAARAAETFEPTVLQMFGNIGRVAQGEPIPEKDLVR